MLPPVFFVCSACGSVVAVDASPGYRCPRRYEEGPSADHHRLVREIEPRRLHWPDLGPENPFLRYRQLCSPYLRFRMAGGSDGGYVERVSELEARVTDATGKGFGGVSLGHADALEIATGRDGGGAVLLQDRTRFGAGPGAWQALLLAVLPKWLGSEPSRLATTMGADDSADTLRLAEILGLEVDIVSELEPSPWASSRGTPQGERSGRGADCFPWTGWKDMNAWVLEGESLWAYRAVDRLRRMGVVPDRVFLPPHGRGSAGWILGLREAYRLGALPSLPRVHVVEEECRRPVGARYDASLREILLRVDDRLVDPELESVALRFPRVRQVFADRIVAGLRSTEGTNPIREAVEAGLRAVLDRAGPGPDYEEILVRGMLESGGFPIAVDPDSIVRGRMLSRREPPERTSGGFGPGGSESGPEQASAQTHAPTSVERSGQGPGGDDEANARVVLPGLASAGMLRLFAQEELPTEDVLLAVDP